MRYIGSFTIAGGASKLLGLTLNRPGTVDQA